MSACALGSQLRDGAISVIPQTGEIVAICLEGDFDLANAPALGDEIDRALESGNHLIFDLSKATFIDSSVIRTLMRAVKAVSGREQALVLQLGTAAIVERLLEIVKIEQVMPRAHDRQEAVQLIETRAACLASSGPQTL